MNKFIDDKMLQSILSHYPENQHKFLIHQLDKMSSIIVENKQLYLNDKGFKDAMDKMISKIVEGEFLLKEKE